MLQTAQTASNILGWLSTVAWILSNHKRKSVQGLSMDFVYLNFLGFISYFIYNITFFCSPTAQIEYRSRFGQDVAIHVNDVVFALHALILSFITLIQTHIYRFPQRRPFPPEIPINSRTSETPSLFAFIYCSTAAIGTFLAILLVWLDMLEFIDFLYALSVIKIGVTLTKYIPQVWMNYSRRSTVGFSIENIGLDLVGGVFSFAQVATDCVIFGDYSPVTGNPVKMLLSLTSVGFDAIFIVQQFVLGYQTEEEMKEDEDSPLLLSRRSSFVLASDPFI